MGDPNVTNQIMDGTGQPAAACTAASGCGAFGGLSNHIRWPDGLAMGDTLDWEGAPQGMLPFLRSHPHP